MKKFIKVLFDSDVWERCSIGMVSFILGVLLGCFGGVAILAMAGVFSLVFVVIVFCIFFLVGLGSKKDRKTRFEGIDLRNAAEKSPEAQYALGCCYEDEKSLCHDIVSNGYTKAIEWYRKAAEAGMPKAQYVLGNKLYYEHPEEAFAWFFKAAGQGYAEAEYMLVAYYQNGKVVPKAPEQAVYWCRKAAEQGNADAQYSLGVRHDNGDGVEKDHEQALYWYRKAAEQGNEYAQEILESLGD